MADTDLILLVNDIPDHCVQYEAALLDSGYRVNTTNTGQAALLLARASTPDCALIDVRLPDMSGWELCRELKAGRDTREASIVMLTPDVSRTCADDSVKAGCHAWLAQPTIAEDVVRAVRHVLNQPSTEPRSSEDALLGVVVCPACTSEKVRATLRVSPVQYYVCRLCAYCWRVEGPVMEDTRDLPSA